jgi:hypothetical protein
LFIEKLSDFYGPSPHLIPFDLVTGMTPPHLQKLFKMSKALGEQLMKQIHD